MQGREVPVKDVRGHTPRNTKDSKLIDAVQIYAGKSSSESRDPIGKEPPKSSAPVVGAVFSPPAQQEKTLPEIAPMRRGRLPAATPQPKPAPKTQTPPMRVTSGDPFAALDSSAAAKSADELSTRFPTLDQFSILHEKGVKFDFDSADSPTGAHAVSEQLVDNAFGITQSQAPQPDAEETARIASVTSPLPERQAVPTAKSASAPPKPSEMSRASEIIMSTPELQAISSSGANVLQPSPTRPTMISTGTMTTPPTERPTSRTPSQYQMYRFPDRHRSSSLLRQQETTIPIRTESPSIPQPGALHAHTRHPSSSSRPSLEGGRPSAENLGDAVAKSRSVSGRPRPVSTHLESNLDFLRERESIAKPLGSPALPSPRLLPERISSPNLLVDAEETNIESNVDFLRSMEEPKPRKSEDSKRASLSSLGKKSIFAGKFGDAFKRFETNQPGAPPARTPSPLRALERRDLTPIAGSEATDGRSDDGQVLEETDDMTPEMRREIERRRLSDEEKRVAAAQAEYRARIAQRGDGSKSTPPPVSGSSRAAAIQNKVQSLLDENARSSSKIKRTAEGYGQFTDMAATPPAEARPEIPRKPVGSGKPSTSSPRPMGSSNSLNRVSSMPPKPVDFSRPVPPPKDIGSRPTAPPKPTHLNKQSTSQGYPSGRPTSPQKPSINTTGMRQTGRLEALVAADLPGQPALDMTAQEKEDYLQDFSKRFPSLTAIEMVERDLAAEENTKPGR